MSVSQFALLLLKAAILVKAVVKNKPGAGAVAFTDWPEPVPGPRQVKIKVRAAGVCGSDIHIWHSTIKIPNTIIREPAYFSPRPGS